MESTYHQQLIARALREIEASPGLGLEALAQRAGLSPAHFQRVFSACVGVSPKRYQQYLTLGLAKRLLAERRSLLDTALSLGLSGPSRLHDLFLTWEAMSPGAAARGGEGLDLAWGAVETPFGRAVAAVSAKGICGLGFEDRPDAREDLMARWPRARWREAPEEVAGHVEAAFAGRGRLHVMGAPFQIKVWEALLAVDPGHVTTYGDLARSLGAPKAARAVGTAVGRNPLAVLIPCHRVLRESGELGGYHWGLPLKRVLLAWEAARVEAK